MGDSAPLAGGKPVEADADGKDVGVTPNVGVASLFSHESDVSRETMGAIIQGQGAPLGNDESPAPAPRAAENAVHLSEVHLHDASQHKTGQETSGAASPGASTQGAEELQNIRAARKEELPELQKYFGVDAAAHATADGAADGAVAAQYKRGADEQAEDAEAEDPPSKRQKCPKGGRGMTRRH